MGSVCHGPAIYAGVVDPKTGEPIIKGKTITGFTTEGAYVMQIMDTLKTWNAPMVAEHAHAPGAKYLRPDGVWDSCHITDGRVITGTNPQSSTETAEAIVEAFDKLQ